MSDLGKTLDEMRLVFDEIEQQLEDLNMGVRGSAAMADGRSFVFRKIGERWRLAVIDLESKIKLLGECNKITRIECAGLVTLLFQDLRDQQIRDGVAAEQGLVKLRSFLRHLHESKEILK